MTVLHLVGEVVDRQTFLNGSRALLVEGSAERTSADWDWTLSVTLPKAAGEPIEEGDLYLSGSGIEWSADVVGGRHTDALEDEAVAGAVTLQLELQRRREDTASAQWSEGRLTARLGLEAADADLELS